MPYCERHGAKRSELAVEVFFHSHIRDFQQHDISITFGFRHMIHLTKVFLFGLIIERCDEPAMKL